MEVYSAVAAKTKEASVRFGEGVLANTAKME